MPKDPTPDTTATSTDATVTVTATVDPTATVDTTAADPAPAAPADVPAAPAPVPPAAGTAFMDHADPAASANVSGIEVVRGDKGLYLVPASFVDQLKPFGFYMVSER